MSIQVVNVPDIGDFKDVPVIEILVKPGDTVKPEDALITLESDKATMDVPSPASGKVVEVLINIGDKVSEGSAIVKLEASAGAGAAAPPSDTARRNDSSANSGRLLCRLRWAATTCRSPSCQHASRSSAACSLAR